MEIANHIKAELDQPPTSSELDLIKEFEQTDHKWGKHMFAITELRDEKPSGAPPWVLLPFKGTDTQELVREAESLDRVATSNMC